MDIQLSLDSLCDFIFTEPWIISGCVSSFWPFGDSEIIWFAVYILFSSIQNLNSNTFKFTTFCYEVFIFFYFSDCRAIPIHLHCRSKKDHLGGEHFAASFLQ